VREFSTSDNFAAKTSLAVSSTELYHLTHDERKIGILTFDYYRYAKSLCVTIDETKTA
jgi:hypothetical protein